MDHILKGNLKWMTYMVRGFISGWMVEIIKANGFTIKCGEWAKRHGQMADHMKEGKFNFY